MKDARQRSSRIIGAADRCSAPRPLLVLASLWCVTGCSTGGDARVTDNKNAVTPRSCPSSSSQPRTYYKDADGDGFGVPGAADVIQGCFDEPPPGHAANAKDCDDGDAKRQVMRYRDRDHDGYGDPKQLVCAAAQDADYADRAEDCDDDDASRSPGAAEIWMDGVDQNCDGSDELRGCIAAPGKQAREYATRHVIEFPNLDAVHVERVESCNGPELYFALLGACPVCGGGRSTLVIGNRGMAAAAFVVASNRARIEVTEPLPQQELSKPLELEVASPESDIRIELLGGAVDCDSSNNVRHVEFGFTDCAAP